MPKTKRDFLKRKLAHAHANIELASNHLSELAVAFEEQHDDLAGALQVAVVGLYNVDCVLQSFALAAWGTEAPPWDSWRNLGRISKKTQDVAEQVFNQSSFRPDMEDEEHEEANLRS
jgi:hypothetical protein